MGQHETGDGSQTLDPHRLPTGQDLALRDSSTSNKQLPAPPLLGGSFICLRCLLFSVIAIQREMFERNSFLPNSEKAILKNTKVSEIKAEGAGTGQEGLGDIVGDGWRRKISAGAEHFSTFPQAISWRSRMRFTPATRSNRFSMENSKIE